MKKICLCGAFVAAVLLSGCATEPQVTYGPDGRVAHALTCHGDHRDWTDCYTEAGRICRSKGYDIIEKNGVLQDGSEVRGSFSVTFDHERSMTISCKN